MPSKQKLIPVQVPWKIDPATPFLRLTALETPSDVPTAVFPFTSDEPSYQPQTSISVVAPPTGPIITLPSTNGAYQLLCVTFVIALWARFSPGYSDRDVVDPSRFDSSAIFAPDVPRSKVDEWPAAYRHEWNRTDLCPNPYMNEVQESDWLNEAFGQQDDFKHFLLMGHDAYVEVIAGGWNCPP